MDGISLNIQGLNDKKLKYLSEHCASRNTFALCLCETWLNSDIESVEVSIKNFELHRTDRKCRSRGGVAIYVNNQFIVDHTSILSHSNRYCEVLALHVKAENIAIVTVYRPPSAQLSHFTEVMQLLNEWLESNCNNETHAIVFGDLNLPYISWERPAEGVAHVHAVLAPLVFAELEELEAVPS